MFGRLVRVEGGAYYLARVYKVRCDGSSVILSFLVFLNPSLKDYIQPGKRIFLVVFIIKSFERLLNRMECS